jgi:hypothetical protein
MGRQMLSLWRTVLPSSVGYKSGKKKKIMAAGSSETPVFMELQSLATRKATIFIVFCP